MRLSEAGQSPWAKFLYQVIVSASCSKHIPSLAVENTLEEDAAPEELIIQAAKRIDKNLPLYIELLQICHKGIQSRENRCQSLGIRRSRHNYPQPFVRLLWRVLLTSVEDQQLRDNGHVNKPRKSNLARSSSEVEATPIAGDRSSLLIF